MHWQDKKCRQRANRCLKLAHQTLKRQEGTERTMTISYQTFKQKVLKERRFVHDEEVRQFLDSLAATFSDRIRVLRKGTVLWRAQKGNDYVKLHDGQGEVIDEVPVPYGKSRMTPDSAKVGSNRANPKGIAYLYLATNPMTAIHEVRPWIGAVVSVAAFEVLCDLRIVDFSQHSGKSWPGPGFSTKDLRSVIQTAPPTAEELTETLLYHVDNAFSRPISRDDEEIEYVPTQIIAEAVRRECYDGIAYKSAFSGALKDAFNVALFEADKSRCISSCMCDVTGVQVSVDGPYGFGGSTDCPSAYTEACKAADNGNRSV